MGIKKPTFLIFTGNDLDDISHSLDFVAKNILVLQ